MTAPTMEPTTCNHAEHLPTPVDERPCPGCGTLCRITRVDAEWGDGITVDGRIPQHVVWREVS